MQFEVEKVSFDDVIYGTVSDRGRDLTKEAYDYMGHPATMPCRENACIVESEMRKDGSWRVALRPKDPAVGEKIRTGQMSIHVDKNARGLIEFDITNIMKSCTCKKGDKNMSELDTLNKQLEQIAEGYITKNSTSPKAAHAAAIAKASLSPEGARISKRIIELERAESAMATFAQPPVQKAAPVIESKNPLVREFYKLVDSRAGDISKSADAPKDGKILKALAARQISIERPDLMNAVIGDERGQAATAMFLGGV